MKHFYSNEKELKNIYSKKLKKYFEKYFLGKNPGQTIPDRIKESTVKLTGVYIEFCMLCDCLDVLIDNVKSTDEYRKIISEILIGIKGIRSDIEKIVIQISDMMNTHDNL